MMEYELGTESDEYPIVLVTIADSNYSGIQGNSALVSQAIMGSYGNAIGDFVTKFISLVPKLKYCGVTVRYGKTLKQQDASAVVYIHFLVHIQWPNTGQKRCLMMFSLEK